MSRKVRLEQHEPDDIRRIAGKEGLLAAFGSIEFNLLLDPICCVSGSLAERMSRQDLVAQRISLLAREMSDVEAHRIHR